MTDGVEVKIAADTSGLKSSVNDASQSVQASLAQIASALQNFGQHNKATVDAAVGEESIIGKGLAAGESVVVDGQLRLTPGAVVETKEKQAGADKKK